MGLMETRTSPGPNTLHLMLRPWVTRFPPIPFFYPGFLKDVIIGPQDHEQP